MANISLFKEIIIFQDRIIVKGSFPYNTLNKTDPTATQMMTAEKGCAFQITM